MERPRPSQAAGTTAARASDWSSPVSSCSLCMRTQCSQCDVRHGSIAAIALLLLLRGSLLESTHHQDETQWLADAVSASGSTCAGRRCACMPSAWRSRADAGERATAVGVAGDRRQPQRRGTVHSLPVAAPATPHAAATTPPPAPSCVGRACLPSVRRSKEVPAGLISPLGLAFLNRASAGRARWTAGHAREWRNRARTAPESAAARLWVEWLPTPIAPVRKRPDLRC